jgi:hypothetical protein
VTGLGKGAGASLLVAALITGLIGGGLALWWRYGLVIALADPSWFCLPR